MIKASGSIFCLFCLYLQKETTLSVFFSYYKFSVSNDLGKSLISPNNIFCELHIIFIHLLLFKRRESKEEPARESSQQRAPHLADHHCGQWLHSLAGELGEPEMDSPLRVTPPGG